MIPYHQSRSILIKAPDEIGDARRRAVSLADSLQFGETESGKIGIIVTELASNLVKHAGGGEILLRVLTAGNNYGLEIMSLDKGPGMQNIDRCMEDGYSTAGSAGTGLGAVSRLSTDMHIYSQAHKGCVLAACLWKHPYAMPSAFLAHGVICRALEGEAECGDGWSIRHHGGHHGDKVSIMMVDGLGHGPVAAKAANMAIASFEEANYTPPGQLVELLHGALLSTRGAALTIAEIDLSTQELTFTGIGNISGSIISGLKTKGLASYNGTAGHQKLKIREFMYACPGDALVIFHTDGLSTKWKLEDYPGLSHRCTSLIAGVLYRDFQRNRDDATIVVLRKNCHE